VALHTNVGGEGDEMMIDDDEARERLLLLLLLLLLCVRPAAATVLFRIRRCVLCCLYSSQASAFVYHMSLCPYSLNFQRVFCLADGDFGSKDRCLVGVVPIGTPWFAHLCGGGKECIDNIATLMKQMNFGKHQLGHLFISHFPLPHFTACPPPLLRSFLPPTGSPSFIIIRKMMRRFHDWVYNWTLKRRVESSRGKRRDWK